MSSKWKLVGKSIKLPNLEKSNIADSQQGQQAARRRKKRRQCGCGIIQTPRCLCNVKANSLSHFMHIHLSFPLYKTVKMNAKKPTLAHIRCFPLFCPRVHNPC